MSEKEIHDLQKQIQELAGVQKEANEAQALAIKDLKDTMKPVIDAYNAANKLGAWAKYALYFVATILGVVIALKEVFKK